MIIGLTGLAGSGKDTVAALLAMRGFTRYAFADELRKEAAETIQSVQRALTCGEFVKPEDREALKVYGREVWGPLYQGELTPEMVWEKPTPPLMRVLLQRHGSEFRRQQDPNYWVSKLMGLICQVRLDYIHECNFRKCPVKNEKVVITDVRFLNEAEAIRDRGGHIWRVVRPTNTAPLDHVSESEQSGIAVDVELINDGTVYDLALKVRGLL